MTKVMELEMPALQEVLKDNNGNEVLLEELLCKFRQWLMQQIHLPQDISDQRLKFFIFIAKFDFEDAKKRLDTLYTLHNILPDMYSNFDPLSEEIKPGYTFFQFVPLSKLTPEKYRVHILRLTDYDASKCNPWLGLRYGMMIIEVRIEEDIVTNNILIWDVAGASIHHVKHYTPMVFKKLDTCLAAYGIRVKAIYVINAPAFVDIIMKIAKPILKAKIFNRIHVYTSGIESLYDVIPKSILPMDYGGEQPSMNTLTDTWHAKLVERRDWLLQEEKRKVDESLRKNSIINVDSLFGVSGTFRKLQID